MPARPQPLARLRILIGCPASGKTTWCVEHRDMVGTRLSLDDTRARLGRHAHDQDASPAAVQAVHLEMTELLQAGHTVTLDATSTEREHRQRWLGVARRYHAHRTAVVLRVPRELAHARNNRRDRSVPREVLERMWRQVDRLTADQLRREGFAEVIELGLSTTSC